METIVAIKYNKTMIGGFKVLEKLKSYKGIDEVIIFLNGVCSINLKLTPYLESIGMEGATVMETDAEIDLSKVFRQIISYVHQSRSEGLLYIIDGSDNLPDSEDWMDWISKDGGTGILIKDFEGECPKFKVTRLSDLFKLRYPLGIDYILNVEDSAYALQSRNFLQFVEYFVTKHKNYFVDGLSGNVAETILTDDQYDIQLLDPTKYSDPLRKIIKYLLNKIEH